MIHNPDLFGRLMPLCQRINKCNITQLKWCMENTKEPCPIIMEELKKE